MPVVFRLGKQRYCQGLPILASLTLVPAMADSPPDTIILASDEKDGFTEQYGAIVVVSNEGLPTAIFEIDTNEVPEGTYSLVMLDRSLVSSPLIVLSKDTYNELLKIENQETFDDERIPATDVFRHISNIVYDCWVKVENPVALLENKVMSSRFQSSLLMSGLIEAEDRTISIAKVSYGAEALLSDLAYLSGVPLGGSFHAQPAALDMRVDQRGNLLLYARTQVGVLQPELLLESMRAYADVTQVQEFHPEVFKARIDLYGVSTFELALTVATESETERHSMPEEAPLESSGGSALRQTEYARVD